MDSQNVNSMDDMLKCPICLDYAENAIECGKCHYIYCNKCYLSSKIKKCAMCRASTSGFKPSPLADRLISTREVSCPTNCGKVLLRGDLKAHELKCEMRDFKCVFCGVSDLKKNSFKDHLLSLHIEEVISKCGDNLKEKSSVPVKAEIPNKPSDENEEESGGFGDLF